jgi:hypothetical protein
MRLLFYAMSLVFWGCIGIFYTLAKSPTHDLPGISTEFVVLALSFIMGEFFYQITKG